MAGDAVPETCTDWPARIRLRPSLMLSCGITVTARGLDSIRARVASPANTARSVRWRAARRAPPAAVEAAHGRATGFHADAGRQELDVERRAGRDEPSAKRRYAGQVGLPQPADAGGGARTSAPSAARVQAARGAQVGSWA